MGLARSQENDARSLFEIDRAMSLSVSLLQQISAEATVQELDSHFIQQVDIFSPVKLAFFLEDKHKQAMIRGGQAPASYEEIADLISQVLEAYFDIHLALRTHSDHFIKLIVLFLTINAPVLGASGRVRNCL